MIPDYILVIGVDWKHLEQLAMTWPTWCRHKPSLLQHPMLIFYDRTQLNDVNIRAVLKDQHPNVMMIAWPPLGVTYPEGNDKWTNQQRHKMLAGFVHVPAEFVDTEYWLKLDTDVVATGMDDWIDPEWFKDSPGIVSHPWGFTRPPDQMLKMDEWMEKNPWKMKISTPPLNLRPRPGSDRVIHKRIISWCAFFHADFTALCSVLATQACGIGHIPIPSQDGYLWYCAQRWYCAQHGGEGIVRTRMKRRGWSQWSTFANVRKYAEEAMR